MRLNLQLAFSLVNQIWWSIISLHWWVCSEVWIFKSLCYIFLFLGQRLLEWSEGGKKETNGFSSKRFYCNLNRVVGSFNILILHLGAGFVEDFFPPIFTLGFDGEVSSILCLRTVLSYCILGLSRLYFTKVKLGSPSREFNVQIDTGSDILWVACSTCSNCPQISGLGVKSCFFNLFLAP